MWCGTRAVAGARRVVFDVRRVCRSVIQAMLLWLCVRVMLVVVRIQNIDLADLSVD